MDQGIDFIRLLATENESEPKSPTKKTRTQSVGDDSETENKVTSFPHALRQCQIFSTHLSLAKDC